MSNLPKSNGSGDLGGQVVTAVYNSLSKADQQLVVSMFIGSLGFVLFLRTLEALSQRR